MSYHPDYRENIADGLIKDLNIIRLQELCLEYKSKAEQWCPSITVDETVMNNTAITITATIIVDGIPQGLSYTISKKEAKYLADGDALVNTIAEQLTLIFESRMREELGYRLKKVLTNMERERV
jgi:hypothetical protein